MKNFVIIVLLLGMPQPWENPISSSSGAYGESGHSSAIIYEETFEGADPFSGAHSIETGPEHALKFVPKPGEPGNRAARFELRDSDPLVKRGTRAEVVIVKGEEGHILKDTWYSFEVYLPSEGFVDEEDTDLINQWHQDGFATTSIRVKNGRFQLKTGPSTKEMSTLDLAAANKDQWHTFVVHFLHSNNDDGLIELWLNDEKVLMHRGGNMYAGQLPKWKIGIYKSTWNDEETATDVRILYYDNIKVGSEQAFLKK